MARLKEYCVHKEFFDTLGHKHTVLVYGEVTQEKIDVEILPFIYQKKVIKSLNFGWAICSEEDEFNEEYGKHLAKKRFYHDVGGLQTGNRNFLCDDMVLAILNNEVNYIISHIDKYVPESSKE